MGFLHVFGLDSSYPNFFTFFNLLPGKRSLAYSVGGKRLIQAWMRRTRCGSKCLRSSSNTFGCCLGSSFAKLSTSVMTLASRSDAFVFTVTGFSSHISGWHSHVGPFHQSFCQTVFLVTSGAIPTYSVQQLVILLSDSWVFLFQSLHIPHCQAQGEPEETLFVIVVHINFEYFSTNSR